MELPINNRLRAEYTIPQEIIEHLHAPDGLVEEMNRQLMGRIASELLIAKPSMIKHSTVKFSDDPTLPEHHRLTAEVFVFTYDELTQLIRKIQIETSTQIREQVDKVNNWKNK